MPLVFKQALAIIDSRTTVICLDVHGVVVPVDAPFETLGGDFQAPPFHVHCRTLVGPHMPGFISEARRAANKELQNRPLKERRKGPDGPGTTIPGPTTDNPPSGFSRRDDDLALANDPLLFENQRKLKDAGKGAGPEQDPWGPTTVAVQDVPPALSGRPAADLFEREQSRLDEATQQSLKRYAFGVSDQLNPILRRGGYVSEMNENRREHAVRVMDAVENAAPLSAAVTVYRGMPASALPDDGKEYKDLGIMSTSLDRDMSLRFAAEADDGALLEIVVPAGARALSLNVAAKGADAFGDEGEVLLPPGTRLEFGPERTEIHDGRPVRVVTAVLVAGEPAKADPFAPTVVSKPAPPVPPLPMAEAAAMLDRNPVLATRDERTAVGLYKAGMTWSQDLRQDRASEFTMERVNQVISINDRQVPITEPVALYRGMSSQFLPADLQPGMVFRDKGFTSTSLDRETAALFKGSGVLLEIVAPVGSKLLPVNHAMIEDQSGVPAEYRLPFNAVGSESEILLMPGSEFEVVGKKKRLINGALVEVLQVNLRPAEG